MRLKIPLPDGWYNQIRRSDEHFEHFVIRKLHELEEWLMALHDETAKLTDDVAALTAAVNVALDELKGIVDTSADTAAVQAASATIEALTASLVAAEPAPAPAPEPPAAPAS